MCQIWEHFVAIARYSLWFSLSLWFRLVVKVDNFILRLEGSVLTVTRKLETGSFLHSFITYLIVNINFSFFSSGQNVTGYFLILVLIVLWRIFVHYVIMRMLDHWLPYHVHLPYFCGLTDDSSFSYWIHSVTGAGVGRVLKFGLHLWFWNHILDKGWLWYECPWVLLKLRSYCFTGSSL
jgi:hypothetical protein